MFGNDFFYMVPLDHLMPFRIDVYHKRLPKTSVRNNSHKTKLKRKTRKFLPLNVICLVKDKWRLYHSLDIIEMPNGMKRILSNNITTSRSVSPKPDLPLTTTSMSFLSSLVNLREIEGISIKSEVDKNILKISPFRNNLNKRLNCCNLSKQSWKLGQEECYHMSLYSQSWNINLHRGKDHLSFKADNNTHNHFEMGVRFVWPLSRGV